MQSILNKLYTTINPINQHPMTDIVQRVLLQLKHSKKDKFPDHICAQANKVMCSAGSICENAHIIKYGSPKDVDYTFIKKSLINTAAECLRMLEEIEKLENK